MAHSSTCMLVIGTHRSGTSVTTGVVQLQGFDLGEPLLHVGDENLLGHFENVRVLEMHEAFLAEIGLEWSTVSDPLSLAGAVRQGRWQTTIEELYRALTSDSLQFAIKDPRTVHFLPLWDAALHRLDVEVLRLVTLRHPAATVRSLQVRNSLPVEHAERIWLHDMAQIRRHVGRQRHGIVRFDQLVRDPVVTMRAAFEAAGAPWNPAVEEPIEAFVHPELDRSTASADPSSVALASQVFAEMSPLDSVADWPVSRW